MSDRLLLGLGRRMIPIPRLLWRLIMEVQAGEIRAGLGFMSADHHRVRDFVVCELAREGRPIPAELIAERLELPVDRTMIILNELEARLIFLVRNAQGAVSWAYPVTVDRTPHRAVLTTGEEAYSP
jgi:hypothetical protein